MGGGVGRSFWLRGIFARLDTTPGQEREIRSAIEELQRVAREAKDGLRDARDDLSKAVLGDTFDDFAVGHASERADAAASKVKEAFGAALKRVHAVLDRGQRERLAAILARGPRWGGSRAGFAPPGFGGPYRGEL